MSYEESKASAVKKFATRCRRAGCKGQRLNRLVAKFGRLFTQSYVWGMNGSANSKATDSGPIAISVNNACGGPVEVMVSRRIFSMEIDLDE